MNCHTQQYIARLMSELGYALDGALTSDKMRGDCAWRTDYWRLCNDSYREKLRV